MNIRFIPTPVGNTARPWPGWRATPVHPHARGEHVACCVVTPSKTGSSPRPWGTLHHLHAVALGSRFIPTPVGNTQGRLRPGRLGPVHPHARGEHMRWPISARLKYGSSPRPWGTRWRRPPLHRPRRFIPTPVGNTTVGDRVFRICAVHPHARGEHQPGRLDQRIPRGSSPRPWGTHVCSGHNVVLKRFIPTPVGNTPGWGLQRTAMTVHPHARGEHAARLNELARHVGSSPRPWGTQHPGFAAARPDRFIPTPVGNTTVTPQPTCPPPVHPHARGEHAAPGGVARRADGSSPRPWGTLVCALRRCQPRRFIPTPVGNT